MIQLYIYVYLFFLIFFSHLGCYIILSTVPCAKPCISFSSLIAVAGTSKTMLNKSGKSGHLKKIGDMYV